MLYTPLVYTTFKTRKYLKTRKYYKFRFVSGKNGLTPGWPSPIRLRFLYID